MKILFEDMEHLANLITSAVERGDENSLRALMSNNFNVVISALKNAPRFASALRDAARNDRSEYRHHEARPFDGRKPSVGTIWLTPREIARIALRERDLATMDDPG